ncbi:MAG: type I-E CRISPR-associated protein Cse1/CasA [Candidatus Competibacteraceae bacterium]|nr:type I-E CRISPR-associated protein Cse1/CasA [Candidatus Competibacteraceae bacterium]
MGDTLAARAGEAPPHGYLDYLTWQSRRVLLDVDGGTVQGVRMLQGLAVDAPHLVDPFMPLRRSKELGMLPLRLQQDRAVWRDAHVLLAHESGEDGEYKRPEVLRHAAQMLDNPPALQLDILGLCSDQAKVNFWRHERLPLPSLYLTDPKSAVHVHELLELSRNAGSALQAALRTLAEHLTASRLGGNTRSGHRETIDKLARSFGGMAAFWGALEPEFQRQYVELPDKDWEELQAAWCCVLRRCARQALERVFSGYEESARSLRAVTEAKRHLNGRLKIVLPEPNKETAAHG